MKPSLKRQIESLYSKLHCSQLETELATKAFKPEYDTEFKFEPEYNTKFKFEPVHKNELCSFGVFEPAFWNVKNE